MTTWIDCSTTLDWRRPPVGVVRTEAECLRHAILLNDPRIKYCRYLPDEDCLIEIKPSFISDHLRFLDGMQVESKATGRSRLFVVKKYIFKILNWLPPKLGNFLLLILQKNKKNLSFFIHNLRRINTKQRHLRGKLKSIVFQKIINRTSLAYPEIFSEGDTYLSVGADWNYMKLSHLIYAYKKKYKLKVVLFCHDVIPINLPHLTLHQTSLVFSLYFCDVAWNADQIICNSEFSKKDLLHFLNEIGAPIPLMNVVTLGSNMPEPAKTEIGHDVRNVLLNDFILYVSTIERRKNHELLYKSYITLIEEGAADLPLLVFVGMPAWGVSDFLREIEMDYRIKPYIRILDRVSDIELNHLYQSCMFTLFPSLCEGWGLPISESLRNGKFCISSNRGAMPEAGSNFVEYLDPWDVKGWADTIMKYYKDRDLLAAKEKFITESYKPQDWETTAKQILEFTKL